MSYTEKKEKNGHKYYYRVESVRSGAKVKKNRIYLGKDMTKAQIKKAVAKADSELGSLGSLLSKEQIKRLEKIKRSFQAQPSATYQNRYEFFTSLFTHNSTAIEGNTLTLRETASLLFEQMVPARSLRDVNEVLNHKKAFDHMLEYEGDVTSRFIKDLHGLLMRDAISVDLSSQVGKWRTEQVYIGGVDYIPPAPSEVPLDMRSLLSWYTKKKGSIHPVVVAVYFHVGFEIIHPFIDGNGRVGRLLLNFILHKNGFPMVNIPNDEKRTYYEVLRIAHFDGDLKPFIEYVIGLMDDERTVF